ncbi:MAG TPA: GntR family transcriptional regulator [Firmicutes bacterium]|nr:GntR family transcriptional regulator [Bacillota bacterium]
MKLLGDQALVVYQPAGEGVFQKLRRMILDGELKHGEHLVERRLAEMMHVSRTPVREALRKLEAEGLVRREPYRGLVVVKFTPQDAVEIFRIREVLEGLATQLAASHRSGTHLRTLRSLLAKMEKALDNGDEEGFGKLHVQFHDAIYRAAESPRLYNLITSVREYLESFTRIGYRLPGRKQQACEEHRGIVERIASGDVISAEEIARMHIRHSKDALLAILERESQEQQGQQQDQQGGQYGPGTKPPVGAG